MKQVFSGANVWKGIYNEIQIDGLRTAFEFGGRPIRGLTTFIKMFNGSSFFDLVCGAFP